MNIRPPPPSAAPPLPPGHRTAPSGSRKAYCRTFCIRSGKAVRKRSAAVRRFSGRCRSFSAARNSGMRPRTVRHLRKRPATNEPQCGREIQRSPGFLDSGRTFPWNPARPVQKHCTNGRGFRRRLRSRSAPPCSIRHPGSTRRSAKRLSGRPERFPTAFAGPAPEPARR